MNQSKRSSEILDLRFFSLINAVVSGHKDEINQIKANQSGTRLASCSDDGVAYIWRVDNITRDSESIPGLSASDHVVALKGHGHSVSTVGWCLDHPAGTNELIAT